jgi:hypothetical protein
MTSCASWREDLERSTTTVFPRQGHYALDPKIVAAYPPRVIERIGDLVITTCPVAGQWKHETTQQLHDLVESLADNITRELLTSGTLRRHRRVFHHGRHPIRRYSIRDPTTLMTIRSVNGPSTHPVMFIFELAFEMHQAADLFRPI